MSKWVELAALCEKATGPDREIDVGIMEALGFRWIGRTNAGPGWLKGSDIVKARSSYVSASLDAITALIEQNLGTLASGNQWWFWTEASAPTCTAEIAPNADEVFVGYGRTPALALCAAFCRAMNEKEANA